ncbi:MI domain-containing protein [Heracleum sosnowskyi]|uniref:Eukaryotic translation initiation factor 4G n=1 Tax=Heracleum sosnowskyi TaxID=360622 RepID=A0AAD8HEJ0_9APIA|nr:MI domain-containing protein [Heracleum sosnowskyi]
MSYNQSRFDKNEPPQYRKTGRSGPRYSGGGKGGGAGGGNAHPPSNKSFKRNNNVQGGQYRVSSGSVGSNYGNAAGSTSGVQNGAPSQMPSHVVVSDAPVTVKPTDMSPQKSSNRGAPEAPVTNTSTVSSNPVAPSTPVTGEAPFPLQFGSISPGLMQIPARTSSAPPTLDEQNYEQACYDSVKGAPVRPIQAIPKHMPTKNAGPVDTSNAVEGHSISEARRDTQVSAGPPSPQTQKTLHPIPGLPMQFPFHQAHISIQSSGPRAQLHPHSMMTSSVPMPIPIPLQMGSPRIPQQVYAQKLQSHMMQSQGVMPRSQNINFSSQLGTQLPQLGSMGFNVTSQFLQQHPGNLGSPRKAVKITHPDTHEELMFAQRTNGHQMSGSSAPQSPPNVSGPSSLPLKSTQITPSSQVPRLYNQVMLKPAVETHSEKNAESSLPISSPSAEKNTSKIPSPHEEACSIYTQWDPSNMNKRSSQQSKPLMSVPAGPTVELSTVDSLITDTSSSAFTSHAKHHSSAVQGSTEGTRRDTVNRSNENKDDDRMPSKKSHSHMQKQVLHSLDTSGNEKKVGEIKQHNEDVNLLAKKYSRDFLMKFSERCIDLPEGFEITSGIAEVLTVCTGNVARESFPGRNAERPMGGPRSHRHGSGMSDDRWGKAPGPLATGRDLQLDTGYGNHGANFVGSRPGKVGNYGVIKNQYGQFPVQYAGGILSGSMQYMGPQLGLQQTNSDFDRWQRGNSFQRGQTPSQTPLQVMHRAERKYEVGKITDEEQAKQRQLKGILNKLTPQNFERLFEQVKQVNIENAGTLTGVISQIFDKALMEPTFCEMYANFCYHLSGELPDFCENNEKITFKRLLLNKCQEEFERGEREQEEANRPEEEGEAKQSDEEREEKRVQARRRMLGNIRLIGELYKKKMLTERIMHECIKKLLGQYQNPDEEDLEALCKLMSTIGEMIDHPKAKVHMDAYFDMMAKLSNNMKLSSRVRFMLKDSIDLRKNKWQQRRKVEGPKKIEEVHRDAANERQAQSNRLTRGPSMGSSFRRQQPTDFAPRGSNISPSPKAQMGGFRGLPQKPRGYVVQDVRPNERHPFENRTLSVPLPQRPLGDNSITLGPQGGLAKGMSIRGQPLVSNVSESRKIPTGPNGYGSVSNHPANASREEYKRKISPDRFVNPSANDEINSIDRNMNFGSREVQNSNHISDTSRPVTPPTKNKEPQSTESVSCEKVWPEEQLRKMSMEAIKEFYSAKDEKEIALCVKDLNAPSFYPSMISIWVTDSFERKDMERDLLAMLLVNLANSQNAMLSQAELVKGFESVLASLEDAVTDAPKAADFLGSIFAKVILENVIPMTEIGRLIYEGGEEQGRLVEIGLAAEVLGSVLEIIQTEKGDPVLNEIRSASELQLENFRPPNFKKSLRLDKFI